MFTWASKVASALVFADHGGVYRTQRFVDPPAGKVLTD